MGTAQVQAGVVVVYRLRPSERPTNPERLWHGIVTEMYTKTCWVRLTEAGHEGLDEIIFFEQIVGIEAGLERRSTIHVERASFQNQAPVK